MERTNVRSPSGRRGPQTENGRLKPAGRKKTGAGKPREPQASGRSMPEESRMRSLALKRRSERLPTTARRPIGRSDNAPRRAGPAVFPRGSGLRNVLRRNGRKHGRHAPAAGGEPERKPAPRRKAPPPDCFAIWSYTHILYHALPGRRNPPPVRRRGRSACRQGPRPSSIRRFLRSGANIH